MLTKESNMSAAQEYVIAGYKASPPVSVATMALAGIPLQEWVYIVTIVYLVLQSAKLIYDAVVKFKRRKEAANGG